jgi:hypothetical protein
MNNLHQQSLDKITQAEKEFEKRLDLRISLVTRRTDAFKKESHENLKAQKRE